MSRVVLARGLIVAALVGVVVALSGPLLLQSAWPVLAGAAIGLVPGRSTLNRAGAFAAGVVAGWLSFALRAAVLPDVPVAHGIAVAVAVAAVAVAAAVSGGRLPLWAALVGFAAYAGAYQAAFTADPTAFPTQSVPAATSLLLASAIGFAAATIMTARAAPDADAAEAETEAPPQTIDLTLAPEESS
jgi:hypothetical protein